MTNPSRRLSKQGVLDRPHWNKGLMRKLLGEPDETVTREDGSIARHWYDQKRVEEAEQAGLFQQKIESDHADKNHRQERRVELMAGLEKAAEMDLNSLVIPDTGDFQTTLSTCLQQTTVSDNLREKLSWEDEHLLGYGGCKVHCNIEPEICRRIAKARPELAFEAGIKYLDLTHNIGMADRILENLHSADSKESSVGEPVYIIYGR